MNVEFKKILRMLFTYLMPMLTACGQLENTDFPGIPLGTIRGQISTQVTIDGPYRLAIAWQKYESENLGIPVGIEMQNFDYPADTIHYSVDIYQPPPVEAFGAMSNLAFGTLLAYQDLNGNGQLDLLPANGHPIDRILDSSSTMSEGKQHAFSILFAREDQELGFPGVSLKKGINIIQRPANASGLNGLNEKRVEELQLNFSNSRWNSEILCPYHEYYKCLCTSPTDLFVDGQMSLSKDGGWVNFYVSTCDGFTTEATLTLNGRLLLPDEDNRSFGLLEETRSIIRNGTNEVKATLDGHRDALVTIHATTLEIIAPTHAEIPANASLEVEWKPAAGAPGYLVSWYGKDLGLNNLLLRDHFASGTRFTIPAEQVTPDTLSALYVLAFQQQLMTPDGSRIVWDSQDFLSLTPVP